MAPPLSSLFARSLPAAASAGIERHAIIDIGSNSIRLVVYEGRGRVAQILFNEKVMAGLGRGVANDGRLSDNGMKRAEAALGRFALLATDMDVERMRTVATAAVRDAANGAEFIKRIGRHCRLDIELLSGDEEAEYSALGVIAGIPDADGVAGDLGGGSLELVRIAGGKVHERLSIPIGTLRLGALRGQGPRALGLRIDKALKDAKWGDVGRGKPFYMVGGAWRALAQLHMHLVDHPLPMVHQYRMGADQPARLVRTLARLAPKRLKAIPNISSGRAATLPNAAALLAGVTRRLGSTEVIASAYGLREGLVYSALPPSLQAEDPLVAGARIEGALQGRFPEHGDLLDAWMAPLFADEAAEDRRLRHAACLLADVAWRAHPDFRAERGLDIAVHHSWVGIDPRGRAMLGAAMFANFGGRPDHPAVALLGVLAPAEDLARAARWGLALRLGQRLTGGTAQALERGGLSFADGRLLLCLAKDHAALYGETVQRRHKALAAALGLEPEFRQV